MPAPLPPALAASRLRANLLGLALLSAVRALFVPYLVARRALAALVDRALAADGPVQTLTPGARAVWWAETAVTAVFALNAAQAAWYVAFPVPLQMPAGPTLVPTPMSSPLTRGYPSPASPSSSPARPSPSTPSKTGTGTLSTPLRPGAQLYRASPLSSAPLSASTARALNLAGGTPPSATGLFYDDEARASPSKVGRQGAGAGAAAGRGGSAVPASAPAGSAGPGARADADFVVVPREEREWAENVWKGVRGRRRK